MASCSRRFSSPRSSWSSSPSWLGDFDSVRDVGGAIGALAIEVARRDPRTRLRELRPPADAARGPSERSPGRSRRQDRAPLGRLFVDPLPSADVLTMGNVLHDWSEPEKLELMRKAFAALPRGGALVAIENVIDDDRRSNMVGLLTSLGMLLETPGGFDYTFEQFERWADEAGFERAELRPLAGASSAAIAWEV